MSAWQAAEPKESTRLADDVAFAWTPCRHRDDPQHVHGIECLWVWHDCSVILGPDSIAPGARFGWRPSGVGAHTLVSIEPLTITASVYWPGCCGLHGFITAGEFVRV